MTRRPKRPAATKVRPPAEPEPSTVVKPPESGPAEDASVLPEKVGSADLEVLNQALAALFGDLRFARSLPLRKTHGRLAAVVALSAMWRFLVQFDAVSAETLALPLISLHSALLALNQNNVEPILKPTKRTGRATSSPRRYALIGAAVGAAQQLEWTGFTAADANREVAKKLSALGIKPTRGKNRVTADTLRRWREHIGETQPLLSSLPQMLQSELSAGDLGRIIAAVNVARMLSDEWREKIESRAPADARRFVLRALEIFISETAHTDSA